MKTTADYFLYIPTYTVVLYIIIDVIVSKNLALDVVDSYAAVYLAAGLENLLEEIMMQCMPSDQETLLTASVLENAIANNGDLWGLLQPYAHLNAGRTATGETTISDRYIYFSFFYVSFSFFLKKKTFVLLLNVS